VKIKHTLYTENKNKEGIESILNKYYYGYTIIEGTGYYKGDKENCLIIVIFTEPVDTKTTEIKINTIISDIKFVNEQECILYTRETLEAEFI